jgi:hypothetical protein
MGVFIFGCLLFVQLAVFETNPAKIKSVIASTSVAMSGHIS